MELSDRLQHCRICSNRIQSFSEGISCGLTNEKPKFEVECPDFTLDEAAKQAYEPKKEHQGVVYIFPDSTLKSIRKLMLALPFINLIIHVVMGLDQRGYFFDPHIVLWTIVLVPFLTFLTLGIFLKKSPVIILFSASVLALGHIFLFTLDFYASFPFVLLSKILVLGTYVVSLLVLWDGRSKLTE